MQWDLKTMILDIKTHPREVSDGRMPRWLAVSTNLAYYGRADGALSVSFTGPGPGVSPEGREGVHSVADLNL